MLAPGDLSQFTGTGNYYRHWTGLKFTDGVKYMADNAGSYWLIDAIASYQIDTRIFANPRLREFQLWKLVVRPLHHAVLTLQADDGEPTVIEQKIEYTDFPLKEITLYVEGNVLLLPSEH